MTNEEILKKAIKKAIENGYQDEKILSLYSKSQEKNIGFIADTLLNLRTEKIIFSHSFAKAFFGNYKIKLPLIYPVMVKSDIEKIAWKYRLQQMVLEKEPLKYLEKFLKEKAR